VADLLEVERRDALARLNRELRVPLNAMLGFAQLIEADAAQRAGHDALRQSRAILSSGRQMLDMVDELLVLREAQLGERSATLMPLDVEATLRRWMLPEATFAADPQHAGPVHAWADPVLMRRLITIAGGREIARAPGTGSGAFVTFDATGAADTVRLRFLHAYRDPRNPDQRSQLRVELVRRLVHAMGATLEIQDLEDRVAFEVGLRRAHVPRADSSWPAAPPVAGSFAALEPADPKGAGISGSVLCVEDDPTTLMLMQHALGAYQGVRLRTATTAAEALRCVAEEMPDLVLLDLVLPGAGGEEVLRRLRRGALHGSGRGPACVVLSSMVDPEVRDRLMAAGADGYLAKPVRLRHLHDTLLRLLGPGRAGAPARSTS
jgi:CheY-like chemotaxis protein